VEAAALVSSPRRADGEVTVVADETLGEQEPLLAELLAAATAGVAPVGPANVGSGRVAELKRSDATGPTGSRRGRLRPVLDTPPARPLCQHPDPARTTRWPPRLADHPVVAQARPPRTAQAGASVVGEGFFDTEIPLRFA